MLSRYLPAEVEAETSPSAEGREKVADGRVDGVGGRGGQEGGEGGVAWMHKAWREGGERAFAAEVVVADLEQAAAFVARLRARPEVADIGGVSRLVIEDATAKRVALTQLDAAVGEAARRVLSRSTTSRPPAPIPALPAEIAPEAATTAAELVTSPEPDTAAEASQASPAASVVSAASSAALRDALRQGQALLTQVGLIETVLSVAADRLSDVAARDAVATLMEATAELRRAAERLNSQRPEPEAARRWLAVQRDFKATQREAAMLVTQLLEHGPLQRSDLRSIEHLFADWIGRGTPPEVLDPHQKADPRVTEGSDRGAEITSPRDWPGGLKLLVYPALVTATDDRQDASLPAASLDRFLAAVREAAAPAPVGGPLERWRARTRSLHAALAAATLISLLVAALASFNLAGRGQPAGADSRTVTKRFAAAGTMALLLVLSGLVHAATLRLLGSGVDLLSWSAWIFSATGVAVWICFWMSRLYDLHPRHGSHADDRHSPNPTRGRDSNALGEALGLTLVAGFVLAAGLRGADSVGLTALAVAMCLSLLLPCIAGMLLWPGVTADAATLEDVEL